MTKLIGLYSPAPRSGKTFAATILAHKGYQPISFAEPIKRMAVEFFMSLGYSKEKSLSLAWVDKSVVLPEINLSVRHVLQTIGTQWGREWISENVWNNCFLAKVNQFSKVVVDDVRFENEVNLIKSIGGKIWLIDRPSVYQEISAHVSDNALANWNNFDHHIINNGTLEEFRLKIDQLIR